MTANEQSFRKHVPKPIPWVPEGFFPVVGSENFVAQFSLPTTGKKKPGTQGTITNELLELPENGI